MPTQVANREVESLILAKAAELGVSLGKTDISKCEPNLEAIEAFVLKLKKPKKSSEDNGKQSKSDKKSD